MENKKKKILIIDDDGTLRSLYTDLFEKEGFEVDQAVEGKEGVEKIKKGEFDLALVDILLPRLKGPKILEEIKNNPPPHPIGPIVILTNQEEEDILNKCRDLGAAGVIIKSAVTPDELLQKVKAYLTNSSEKEKI